ncbi:hypothetical protein SLEP1_g21121 [Rubroshorea leprosula]|uniref:Uncharacterized protein n=1 Tax=Rubroshorea leprosula TaxID=152421 RepID=A0AAV5J4Y1_9ROSI|nr:hypothetical protein SLEP1_g21121 [Rubroshorea leprosula]
MSASTKQELERTSQVVNSRLKRLNVFDSVKVTTVSGPPELPGTSNELDPRYAIPLDFYRAALNFGVSAVAIFPLGKESLNKGTFRGPTTLWGFKTRGLGLTEPRREINDEIADPSKRDYLAGDLAFSAFADLSFDLP